MLKMKMKNLALLGQITLCIVQTVFTRPLPNSHCNPLCGGIGFHNIGVCQTDGRCLCWWGWTGPNSNYINQGVNRNRILADHCTEQCFHNHF